MLANYCWRAYHTQPNQFLKVILWITKSSSLLLGRTTKEWDRVKTCVFLSSYLSTEREKELTMELNKEALNERGKKGTIPLEKVSREFFPSTEITLKAHQAIQHRNRAQAENGSPPSLPSVLQLKPLTGQSRGWRFILSQCTANHQQLLHTCPKKCKLLPAVICALVKLEQEHHLSCAVINVMPYNTEDQYGCKSALN